MFQDEIADIVQWPPTPVTWDAADVDTHNLCWHQKNDIIRAIKGGQLKKTIIDAYGLSDGSIRKILYNFSKHGFFKETTSKGGRPFLINPTLMNERKHQIISAEEEQHTMDTNEFHDLLLKNTKATQRLAGHSDLGCSMSSRSDIRYTHNLKAKLVHGQTKTDVRVRSEKEFLNVFNSASMHVAMLEGKKLEEHLNTDIVSYSIESDEKTGLKRVHIPHGRTLAITSHGASHLAHGNYCSKWTCR